MPFVNEREPAVSSMVRFLEDNEFVISVDELYAEPEVYNRLGYIEMPSWINELSPWLIVPLMHINKLIGFIVLDHSTVQKRHFNWEDSDLLKTAARQVASYLEQQETAVVSICPGWDQADPRRDELECSRKEKIGSKPFQSFREEIILRNAPGWP